MRTMWGICFTYQTILTSNMYKMFMFDANNNFSCESTAASPLVSEYLPTHYLQSCKTPVFAQYIRMVAPLESGKYYTNQRSVGYRASDVVFRSRFHTVHWHDHLYFWQSFHNPEFDGLKCFVSYGCCPVCCSHVFKRVVQEGWISHCCRDASWLGTSTVCLAHQTWSK